MSAKKLTKYLSINKYTINLKLYKQLSYKLIYSLRYKELEAFKTYVKINLVNTFIRLFKSLTRDFILFIKKLDRNFCLYINY